MTLPVCVNTSLTFGVYALIVTGKPSLKNAFRNWVLLLNMKTFSVFSGILHCLLNLADDPESKHFKKQSKSRKKKLITNKQNDERETLFIIGFFSCFKPYKNT